MEHWKSQKTGILKFCEFSHVWFNLALCGLNLILRKLFNESLKWNGTWDLTRQGPSPLLVTITGDLFKLVYFKPPPHPTGTDICWLLKHVRLAQAGDTHPTGMLSCQSEIGITLSFLS